MSLPISMVLPSVRYWIRCIPPLDETGWPGVPGRHEYALAALRSKQVLPQVFAFRRCETLIWLQKTNLTHLRMCRRIFYSLYAASVWQSAASAPAPAGWSRYGWPAAGVFVKAKSRRRCRRATTIRRQAQRRIARRVRRPAAAGSWLIRLKPNSVSRIDRSQLAAMQVST